MLTTEFKAWTKRCIELVEKEGITETNSFEEEVIFSMEEGAERQLDDEEKEIVSNVIAEKTASKGHYQLIDQKPDVEGVRRGGYSLGEKIPQPK